MNLNDALLLAEDFSNWVKPTFQESAKGAEQTIKWFIHRLYENKFEIVNNQRK